MKTKLIALLLLAVFAFSLASCGGNGDTVTTTQAPSVTTTTAPAVTTTTAAANDPLRTEPAKVTTTAPQPATPGNQWGPDTPIK